MMAYYHFICDYWRFFRSYYPVRSDDEYWDNLINEGRNLSEKYKNREFAMTLIIAAIDEFERLRKSEAKP